MPMSMGSLALEGAAGASGEAAGALDMAETDEGEGFPRGKSTDGAMVARYHRLLRNTLILNNLHDIVAGGRHGAVAQTLPFSTACFAKTGK
jgi:hypothetical protein